MRSHHFEPGAARFAPALCSVPPVTGLYRGLAAACVGCIVLLAPASRAVADDVALPPISVGAGVRTSFEYNDPTVGRISDKNKHNNKHQKKNGHVMDHINFMFN